GPIGLLQSLLRGQQEHVGQKTIDRAAEKGQRQRPIPADRAAVFDVHPADEEEPQEQNGNYDRPPPLRVDLAPREVERLIESAEKRFLFLDDAWFVHIRSIGSGVLGSLRQPRASWPAPRLGSYGSSAAPPSPVPPPTPTGVPGTTRAIPTGRSSCRECVWQWRRPHP